jgi:hypothetical protein
MKRRTVRRGLYRREITSINSDDDDDDVRAVFEELSEGLDRYVSDARRFAEGIVQDAGIDVSSLFDVVRTETREYIRFFGIDREALPPDVDQALQVIEWCRNVQRNLHRREYRNPLSDGIRLAMAIEHLNANLAWQKPVKIGSKISQSAVKGNKQRGAATRQTAEEKWQPRCDELAKKNTRRSWNDICKTVAAEFKTSRTTVYTYCTDPRK